MDGSGVHNLLHEGQVLHRRTLDHINNKKSHEGLTDSFVLEFLGDLERHFGRDRPSHGVANQVKSAAWVLLNYILHHCNGVSD